jgi:hypothetical protein
MSKSKARNLADLLGGTGSAEFQGESGIILPDGTTAQRPSPATVGTARYNTDIGKNEVYDSDGWTAIAPPPVVASVSPTSINESDTTQTIVITGQKFDANATALMIDSNGTAITPTTSTRNTSSQITITYSGGDVVSNPNEPYDIKVVNGTGLSSVLEDAVSLNETPDWSTTSGTVATVVEDVAMANVSLNATDPEGSEVSYTITSGALPTGLSLNSSGIIYGTPNVNDTYNASGVTHNFTVTASDGANSSVRSFNIIRKWIDGSTSALAAPSAVSIKTLTATTTDGQYWINIDGTPRLIYCDMNNDGGGWMFAGRMNGNTTTWVYSSSLWTDSNVTNSSSSPTTNADIKTYAWFAAMTQMRYSMGSIANRYVDTHSSFTQSDGTGLKGVFSVSEDYRLDNTNSARNTNQTRTTWINLFNGAGIGTYGNGGSGISWDNCNYRGVNIASNTDKIRQRYGISINNETNCNSSDYFMGIGFGGSDHLGNVSSATKESYNGSYRQQYPVSWLYVK